ncbi:MAG: hypothetical protein ACO1O1_07350 [Adhaeribacter sp.]
MEEFVINSKRDLQAVANRIEEIKDAAANSPEAQELKIITRALVAYEKRILRNASSSPAGLSLRLNT